MENGFSVAVALAFGIALTIHAYKKEILDFLDRIDAAFLKTLKPYLYASRHGSGRRYRGRHWVIKGETFYRYDKQGEVVIWRENLSKA